MPELVVPPDPPVAPPAADELAVVPPRAEVPPVEPVVAVPPEVLFPPVTAVPPVDVPPELWLPPFCEDESPADEPPVPAPPLLCMLELPLLLDPPELLELTAVEELLAPEPPEELPDDALAPPDLEDALLPPAPPPDDELLQAKENPVRQTVRDVAIRFLMLAPLGPVHALSGIPSKKGRQNS